MCFESSSNKVDSFQQFQKGVAAVEFAIILIPLLLIVAGIVEFGRTFWYYDALAKATRDGARLMATANSDGILAAKGLAEDFIVIAANSARVSPPITSVDNVLIECLDAAYGIQNCTDGVAPTHVRVSITNFNISIGEWIPFITESGVTSWNNITLSPSTTMRYLCTGPGSC
jgi:Flp pilus assembly protein TadG